MANIQGIWTDQGSNQLAEAPADLGEERSVARQLGWGFWLCVVWLGLVVILALLAPVLPLTDPNKTAVGGRLEGPRPGLWFGADSTGRDVLSLTSWGARISLLVGFIANFVGFLIG
jgi:peptide/nickel transport system permease protein